MRRKKQPWWTTESGQQLGENAAPTVRTISQSQQQKLEAYKPPNDWIRELSTLLAKYSGSSIANIEKDIDRHLALQQREPSSQVKAIRRDLTIIYAILCKKIKAEEVGLNFDQSDTAAIQGVALQLTEGLGNCVTGIFERVTEIRGRWEIPFSLAGLLQNYRTELVENVARGNFAAAHITEGMEVHFVHAHKHYATRALALDVPVEDESLRYYNDGNDANSIANNIKQAILERYTPLGMVAYIENRLRNQYDLLKNVLSIPSCSPGQSISDWREQLDNHSETLCTIVKPLLEMVCTDKAKHAELLSRFLTSKKINLGGRPPEWLDVYTDINWPAIRKIIYETLCEQHVLQKSSSEILSVALHPDITCGARLQKMLMSHPVSPEFTYWFLNLASDDDIKNLYQKASQHNPRNHAWFYHAVFRMDGGYEKLNEVITRCGTSNPFQENTKSVLSQIAQIQQGQDGSTFGGDKNYFRCFYGALGTLKCDRDTDLPTITIPNILSALQNLESNTLKQKIVLLFSEQLRALLIPIDTQDKAKNLISVLKLLPRTAWKTILDALLNMQTGSAKDKRKKLWGMMSCMPHFTDKKSQHVLHDILEQYYQEITEPANKKNFYILDESYYTGYPKEEKIFIPYRVLFAMPYLSTENQKSFLDMSVFTQNTIHRYFPPDIFWKLFLTLDSNNQAYCLDRLLLLKTELEKEKKELCHWEICAIDVKIFNQLINEAFKNRWQNQDKFIALIGGIDTILVTYSILDTDNKLAEHNLIFFLTSLSPQNRQNYIDACSCVFMGMSKENLIKFLLNPAIDASTVNAICYKLFSNDNYIRGVVYLGVTFLPLLTILDDRSKALLLEKVFLTNAFINKMHEAAKKEDWMLDIVKQLNPQHQVAFLTAVIQREHNSFFGKDAVPYLSVKGVFSSAERFLSIWTILSAESCAAIIKIPEATQWLETLLSVMDIKQIFSLLNKIPENARNDFVLQPSNPVYHLLMVRIAREPISETTALLSILPNEVMISLLQNSSFLEQLKTADDYKNILIRLNKNKLPDNIPNEFITRLQTFCSGNPDFLKTVMSILPNISWNIVINKDTLPIKTCLDILETLDVSMLRYFLKNVIGKNGEVDILYLISLLRKSPEQQANNLNTLLKQLSKTNDDATDAKSFLVEILKIQPALLTLDFAQHFTAPCTAIQRILSLLSTDAERLSFVNQLGGFAQIIQPKMSFRNDWVKVINAFRTKQISLPFAGVLGGQIKNLCDAIENLHEPAYIAELCDAYFTTNLPTLDDLMQISSAMNGRSKKCDAFCAWLTNRGYTLSMTTLDDATKLNKILIALATPKSRQSFIETAGGITKLIQSGDHLNAVLQNLQPSEKKFYWDQYIRSAIWERFFHTAYAHDWRTEDNAHGSAVSVHREERPVDAIISLLRSATTDADKQIIINTLTIEKIVEAIETLEDLAAISPLLPKDRTYTVQYIALVESFPEPLVPNCIYAFLDDSNTPTYLVLPPDEEEPYTGKITLWEDFTEQEIQENLANNAIATKNLVMLAAIEAEHILLPKQPPISDQSFLTHAELLRKEIAEKKPHLLVEQQRQIPLQRPRAQSYAPTSSSLFKKIQKRVAQVTGKKPTPKPPGGAPGS